MRKFLSFDKIHAAHVQWLPVPDYPMGTPVLCRLVFGNAKPIAPCVISITDIDPSRIIILHADTCMYMVRKEGINTMS